MKKILIWLLVLAFLISMSVFSVSCKAPAAPAEEEVAEEAEEEVAEEAEEEVAEEAEKEPVTIMHWAEEGDPPTVAVYAELISEFEKQYPWITVEYQITPDQPAMVTAAVASGGEIDVFDPTPGAVNLMMEQDLLLPLTDIVNNLGGPEIYLPNGIISNDNNDVIAIPFSRSGYVWYIRKDLLEEAGIPLPDPYTFTFDKAIELAEKLTKDGMYGAGLPVSKDLTTYWFFAMFAHGSGIDFWDEDFKVTFDDPRVIEAMKAYTDLLKYAPPECAEWTWYDIIDGFTSEKVAMTTYAGRLLSRVYTDATQLKGKVYAVEYPHSKNFPSTPLLDVNVRAIYAKTKYPEACKLYLEWICQPENLVKFYATVPGHIMPSTYPEADIFMDLEIAEISENPQIMEVMIKGMENAFDPSAMVGGIDYENKQIIDTGIRNPYIESIQTGEILGEALQRIWLLGEDPETVAKDAQEQLEAKTEELKELLGN